MRKRIILLTVCVVSLWFSTMGFGVGCLSAESVSSKWDDYEERHNFCEVDADCETIYGSCPLPCYSYVNVEELEEAQHRSDALIRRYELSGASCDYECVETPEPICEEGRCVESRESSEED